MNKSLQGVGLDFSFNQTSPFPLDVALRCEAGELLALVGPSGAGKSTILRMVAGLQNPERGWLKLGDDFWFDSARRLNLKPQQRRVGLVFQNYALMPHLNATDNVAMACEGPNRAARRAVAKDWLIRMGLTKTQTARLPSELSGGQQQRVALARALARQPSVLLLDEPFSAVDQMTRQTLYHLLADLRQGLNIPILWVTHDMAEARLVADRLAVLDAGQVLQTGQAKDIYTRPYSRKVADLVGIQNRFSGVWYGPDEQAGMGRLQWVRSLKPEDLESREGPLLKVKDKGKIPAGYLLNWVVPPEALTLHLDPPLHSRPSERLLEVELITAKDLGEMTLIAAQLTHAPRRVLKFSLSGPERKLFEQNQRCWVLMDQALIHVMPKKSHKAVHLIDPHLTDHLTAPASANLQDKPD